MNQNWMIECQSSGGFSAIKPGLIHHFLHKIMLVPSQENNSSYPFVWCVWAFDLAIWLGTFPFWFFLEVDRFMTKCITVKWNILFKLKYWLLFKKKYDWLLHLTIINMTCPDIFRRNVFYFSDLSLASFECEAPFSKNEKERHKDLK